MSHVRLYGCSIGHGSYARITSGIRRGLEAHGLLAGFVPVDAFDQDEPYPGQNAPVALVVGPSVEGFQLAKSDGFHESHLVLIAPNSTWLPERMLRYLVGEGASLGAPSAWGKSVIDGYLQKIAIDAEERLVPRKTAWIYRHGVDPGFAPDPLISLVDLVAAYEQGDFSVAHFTSSTGERKGTRELVKAWHELMLDKKLPPGAKLDVYYNGAPGQIYALVNGDPLGVSVHEPPNAPVDEMCKLYREHHLVAQPSRGEGFGLVPLEAAATGTVVLATDVTGHHEYMLDVPSVYCPAGPLGLIDDGPGALAPSVSVEHVGRALERAYAEWRGKSEAARTAASEIQKRWSWEMVTDKFKRDMKERSWI